MRVTGIPARVGGVIMYLLPGGAFIIDPGITCPAVILRVIVSVTGKARVGSMMVGVLWGGGALIEIQLPPGAGRGRSCIGRLMAGVV